VERVGAKHCHLLIREHRSSRFYKLGEAKHGENRLEMSKHVMCWQDRISINGIKGFRRARSRFASNTHVFCVRSVEASLADENRSTRPAVPMSFRVLPS